jgi:hypothetical protein
VMPLPIAACAVPYGRRGADMGCCLLKLSTNPDDMPDGQRQIIAEVNL